MKTRILFAALIVVSVSAYSQTKENTNTKNEHGTEVNSVAKVQGDATAHGENVSTVASSKAQGSAEQNNGLLHRKRKEGKSDKPEMEGSKAGTHRQGMSGADAHKGTGIDAGTRTGVQKGIGISAGARTGVQGKISRPGIRTNIRVNAGIRGL